MLSLRTRPPSYALPTAKFDPKLYSSEVQGWLAEYEKAHGPRGFSDVTAEKVPLSQTCGRVRVIDVRSRIGAVPKEKWPSSPEITEADIVAFEKEHGPLAAGDIVVFRTDWTDQHYKPLPKGAACWEDPLNGKSEGWPAPGPEAIAYLAGKGIRCIGTDAPTLGGVDPKRALFAYWMLGTKGMVGIEMLTNLGAVPKDGYLLFAAGRIRDCHGGPGRAIVLH